MANHRCPAFVSAELNWLYEDYEGTLNVSNDARPYGLEMESRAANTVIPVKREIMSWFERNHEFTERQTVFDLLLDEEDFLE